MSEVAIYILTYPGDYYLSTALVRSLKYFAPGVPIMIIPGEGFDQDDNPFDVPVMRKPDGFWGEIKHADRKFWSFQGPYEKFLYLDADIICTRPLYPLIEQLKHKNENSISVKINIEDELWREVIADPEHKWHKQSIQRVQTQIGNIGLLKIFDPDYDPYARYPFNDGLFSSVRGLIDEASFKELYEREKEFFRDNLGKNFDWKSFDLFFGDQGRLNYLVDRLSIKRDRLSPYGNYQWGGEVKEVSLDKVLSAEAERDFIHWAGCPRPSLSIFCRKPLLSLLSSAFPGLPPEYKTLKEIPGYSVWRHFSAEEQKKKNTLAQRLKWTWLDVRKIARFWSVRVKGTINGLLKKIFS